MIAVSSMASLFRQKRKSYYDRINELEDKLKEAGAKVTGSISGKTDVFIKGEDVGPRKKLDAKSQKAERPNKFHIFTQKGVANKLGLNLL